MAFSEQDKKTLSIGIFVAVVVFAGLAYWHFFVLKRHYKRNESLKTTIKEEINKYKDELAEIREVEAQRGQIDKMRAVVQEAAKRLPNRPDAPGFFNELIRILRITGVQTTRVDPQPPRGQVLYTEIPYSIVSRCRYHEFGQFLNLIEENQKRFMRVNSFNIINDDNRPSVHPVTVGISTFMFNKP